MTDIQRIRVGLTGFPGAPGVSTFYSLDAAGLLAALRALYYGRRNDFPSDVRFTFEPGGDIIDPATGALTGTWSGTAPADVVGLDSGTYTGPCGLVINWLTGDVMDGHRVRGKTYMVPLAGVGYDLTGSIEASRLTAFRADAATFVSASAGQLVVWHRPKGTRAGGFAVVTGSSVTDKAAVLRSRRD